MSGAIDKTLGILEFLAEHPEGSLLVDIATRLNQSRSGCHRTLMELVAYGFVRQTQRGEYRLTTKLPAMGVGWFSKSGIIDIAQPGLQRLAAVSGELVRLAIVDGERLTLVAKAQGANSGLLYDPDMGIDLKLSCSAAGHALLMTLSDEMAVQVASRQGLGNPRDFGPNAPTTIARLLEFLAEHRRRGYALIRDVYAPGMSSMAVPVQRRGDAPTAAIVIAGPSLRFTDEKMQQCSGALIGTCNELALIGSASPLLEAHQGGTWGNRG
ncbi:IclR family transcriptional regulator [Devosia rhizoryzae]|uniref:IclR family transcriptional regulator n=1 Tax=Devosia rhizoryzae TaxID=2774137 RepID=A0ABX7C8F1_9HYPH|nr:IclR family transcriptional regulator [Devosia rhizoryzae]QQR40022.1 IclR family transcriptional regulator [Devosia rhizoryzae]